MQQGRKFQYYTILYVICGDEVLLGKKRRGFGFDLFHGYGGKIENIETKEQCIIREMYEESKIRIHEEQLKLLGFTVHSEPAQISRVVFVFTMETQSKLTATETDEMTPQWFHVDQIPYDDMLPDNRFYLPLVFEKKLFRARFTLNSDNQILESNIVTFKCTEDIISEFQSNYSC